MEVVYSERMPYIPAVIRFAENRGLYLIQPEDLYLRAFEIILIKHLIIPVFMKKL